MLCVCPPFRNPGVMRNGYDPKDLAAWLTAKPSEIKLLLRDQLEPTRAEELLRQMQAAGLPVPDRIGGAEASKGA